MRADSSTGKANTTLVEDVPEPTAEDGLLQVEGSLVGGCATGREIAATTSGRAADSGDRLVIGYESLVRDREAPEQTDFIAITPPEPRSGR